MQSGDKGSNRSKSEVLQGLGKQYGRLVGLCEGLGVHSEPLNIQAGQERLKGQKEEDVQVDDLIVDR